MRTIAFVFILTCIAGCCACGYTNAGTRVSVTTPPIPPASSNSNSSTDAGKPSQRVDFPTQIKPILEAKCQPCHFSGGKVYQKMPFDQPATIKTLGTKLFTRIKDEKERRLISDFLAQ